MNIVTYVKKNYDKLPKSNFNADELVIVLNIRNEDYGYGNHSYEGVGINRDGKIFWCFSSGCSCTGSCEVNEHTKKDLKKFEVDSGFDLTKIDWRKTDFNQMQVSYNDY
jgi:hypothetical protein